MQSKVRVKGAEQGTHSAHYRGRAGMESGQPGSRAPTLNHRLCSDVEVCRS